MHQTMCCFISLQLMFVMLIFMFVLLIFMEKGIKEKWVSGKTLNSTLLKVIADVQVTRE